MAYYAESVATEFTIAAERLPTALAAINAAFAGSYSSVVEAVEELTDFRDCQESADEGFELGCNDDRYSYDTESVLSVLAPFAAEGSYARFNAAGDGLFGFRVLGGRLRAEHGAHLWQLDNEATERIGGLLAPLRVERDAQMYAQWWAALADRDQIGEAVASVREAADDRRELEFTLQALMLSVFQGDSGAVRWLRVAGLRPGVEPWYVTVDIEPSYGTDGVLDGVNIVLNLHTSPDSRWVSVLVYEDSARWLVPESINDPERAAADVIDAALAAINEEIERRDKFIICARDVLIPS